MGLLREFLKGEGVLLGDGGMISFLISRGFSPQDAPERLNAEGESAVLSVYEAYLEAGADVITTNTFGGNRFRLRMHGLEGRLGELNLTGARLARRVADASGREVLVAGAVGPTGLEMGPGKLPFREAVEAFVPQCRALAEGEVDFILMETMGQMDEVRAAAEAARSACGLPVFCTMSFHRGGRTCAGVPPEEAAEGLSGLGLDAIGANCGSGPVEMEAVLRRMMSARPRRPIIAQSNAGLPRREGTAFVYDLTPQQMAAHGLRCREVGTRYIGGCCGTTPAHIAALGEALRRA